MARVKFFSTFDISDFEGLTLPLNAADYVSSVSSNRIEISGYTYLGNAEVILGGRFNGSLDWLDGRLSSVSVRLDGDRLMTATGLNADVSDLLQTWDALEAIELALDGRDRIFGSDGSDVLSGFGRNDVLAGKRGHDALYGGDGSDRLLGDAGDDTLTGGDGKDTLKGGSGRDTFVFDDDGKPDVVRDFDNGKDRLAIDTDWESDFSFTDFSDVSIRNGRGFDKLLVGGDVVAIVYGDNLQLDDIILI